MKTLGILGGLGPLAGAHFYRRLIELTPARGDEGHLPVVLQSEPSIPSRLRHLSGDGVTPVPQLQAVARNLVAAGADLLVVPSSTTHIYYKDIARAVDVPVIDLIGQVGTVLHKKNIRTVAIVATTPTRTYGVYDAELSLRKIQPTYPPDSVQNDIMNMIYAVKHGEKGATDPNLGLKMLDLCCESWASGADALLLACTEVPVIFPRKEWVARELAERVTLIDASDVLARAAIDAAWCAS